MEVEETVDDVVDTVAEVMKESSGAWIPVVGGLLILGAGIGIGYLLGRRSKYEVIKLGDRLPERPPKVILDAKDYENKPENTQTPMKTIRVESEKVEVTVDNTPVKVENVFAHTDDEWDYKAEVDKRTIHAPYVIHRDEYFAEEMEDEGFTQSTLTYYVQDNVLADENDAVVYNGKDLVGSELKFGHGSGDPNTVYIRNMERQQEFEVIRDPGSYEKEILGLEEEPVLKHSREPRFRKEPD